MNRTLLGIFYAVRRATGAVASVVPGFKPWLLRRYDQALRARREVRIKLTKKKKPVTRRRMVQQLKDLGLQAGDTVMAHSSLGAMGYVEGGADTVIDALLDVLGPTGTLLVPAYPIRDWSTESLHNLPVLERDSESRMGAITNSLMRRKGVVRSLHPSHSWIGVGPQADFLLRDHHQSITPCGPNTPFDRMLQIDGWVVTLGSPWGKCTFWHVIEDRVSYPLNVYFHETFSAPVRFPDGSLKQVPFKIHDPALGKVRIDRRRDHELMILDRFQRYGLVRKGSIGSGEAVAVRARDFLEGLKLLLEEGITIYKGRP